MTRRENFLNRFGSTHKANALDLKTAGLFEKHLHSIFTGFIEGRAVYFHGPSGVTLTEGARAGKPRDVLAYNLLPATYLQNIIMLDPKKEGWSISTNQTTDDISFAC